MNGHSQRGQVNPTIAFLLVGLIISCVWVWKRLTPDTQDVIVEQAVPLVAVAAAVLACAWIAVRRLFRRRGIRRERTRLLAQFQRESSPDKRFGLACELIELNEYRLEGLEAASKDFLEIFSRTL